MKTLKLFASAALLVSLALVAVAQKVRQVQEERVAVVQKLASASVVAPNGAHNQYRTLLRTIEAAGDRGAVAVDANHVRA